MGQGVVVLFSILSYGICHGIIISGDHYTVSAIFEPLGDREGILFLHLMHEVGEWFSAW